MADDNATTLSRDSSIPFIPDKEVCSTCEVEVVSTAMEYETRADHHEVSGRFCYCCAAALLLLMPHTAAFGDLPQSIRKASVPLTVLPIETDPEVDRPLKIRRMSEQFIDHMCEFCDQCQTAVSIDLRDGNGAVAGGDYCYRCAAKSLIEVQAGKYKLADSDTAIVYLA